VRAAIALLEGALAADIRAQTYEVQLLLRSAVLVLLCLQCVLRGLSLAAVVGFYRRLQD
jgi:hypothetical protein